MRKTFASGGTAWRRLRGPAVAWPPLTGNEAALLPPAGVIFLPGEDVLLLAVPFPKMTPTQRRAAAAFAVEHQIACAPEDVHAVPGPVLPDGRWLVAVTGRAVLAAHLARLAPPAGTRVLPDTLALPVPAAGQWSVLVTAGRALLRCADGTGLALPLAQLPVLHAAAGVPGVVLYGGEVPDGITEAERRALPPVLLPAGFDLRPPAAALRLPRALARVGVVVAVAALGHLALLAAEGVALQRQQRAGAVALRAALTAQGEPAGTDPETALLRLLAPRSGNPAGFMPLLTTAVAALAPEAGRVTLRGLRYGDGSLVLDVAAPDLATLQRVETALGAATLAVSVGAASATGGLAEQQLTLRAVAP